MSTDSKIEIDPYNSEQADEIIRILSTPPKTEIDKLLEEFYKEWLKSMPINKRT